MVIAIDVRIMMGRCVWMYTASQPTTAGHKAELAQRVIAFSVVGEIREVSEAGNGRGSKGTCSALEVLLQDALILPPRWPALRLVLEAVNRYTLELRLQRGQVDDVESALVVVTTTCICSNVRRKTFTYPAHSSPVHCSKNSN